MNRIGARIYRRSSCFDLLRIISGGSWSVQSHVNLDWLSWSIHRRSILVVSRGALVKYAIDRWNRLAKPTKTCVTFLDYMISNRGPSPTSRLSHCSKRTDTCGCHFKHRSCFCQWPTQRRTPGGFSSPTVLCLLDHTLKSGNLRRFGRSLSSTKGRSNR
jgi:hypothetical protein